MAAEVTVFDLSGRLVRHLVERRALSGSAFSELGWP